MRVYVCVLFTLTEVSHGTWARLPPARLHTYKDGLWCICMYVYACSMCVCVCVCVCTSGLEVNSGASPDGLCHVAGPACAFSCTVCVSVGSCVRAIVCECAVGGGGGGGGRWV